MAESVGERIERLAMEKRKETLAQFAASLGVSYETTRKWKTGATEPNRKRLAKICELLKVSPDEVLFAAPDSGPSVVAQGRPAAKGARVWLSSPDVQVRITQLSPDRLWALENVVRAFLGAEPVQMTTAQGMIQSLAVQLAQLPEDSEEARAEKTQRITLATTIAQQGAAVLPVLARGLPGSLANLTERRRATDPARQGG